MKTILITGANRGLGLEFARQYLQDGWRIYATARQPQDSAELNQLARDSRGQLTVHGLDVRDFDRIEELAEELEGVALDIFLNNAGVYGKNQAFGDIDYENWRDTLLVNTMAPLKMMESFVSHLERGQAKIIGILTSKMGSIDDNTSGGYYIYRSSKTAVNMVCKSLSLDLQNRGITVVVLHPGWVKTDMGGPGAPLEPEESIGGLKKVLASLTPEDGGKFFNYDGTILPW